MSELNVLKGKLEGMKALKILSCKCEDNIKMDLSELGWGDMYRIHSDQDRNQWRALVNTAMNLPVPHDVGYLLSELLLACQ
jgi:hypothetical protein